MSRTAAHIRHKNRSGKHNGFVLILLVLSMLGILGVVFVTGLATGGDKNSRDATTTIALAKAKEALLAYTVTGEVGGRPGEFPCPTTLDPTAANYGVTDSTTG